MKAPSPRMLTAGRVLLVVLIGFFIASLLCADSFQINRFELDETQNLSLDFPGAADSYHWIESAPTVTGSWSVVAIVVGTNDVQTWTTPLTNYPSDGAFFRVRRIPLSAPLLEFSINNNALYTSNTTVSLDLGPVLAEQVALSETPDMSNSLVQSFSRNLSYSFQNTNNGWRVLYGQYLRDGGTSASPVISSGIYLDTVPPVLTVDLPADGSATNVAVVRIEGSVDDATSPVQVTVNGQRADGIVAGRYRRDPHSLILGTNQIVVVATDAAGNRSSVTLNCTLDTNGDVTPPSVALDMPFDYQVSDGVTNWYDQTTVGEDDLLRVHALAGEAGVTASFTVAGTAGTNGPYTGVVSGADIWTRITLFPGTNVLSWVVSDAAGNQVQSARTIIRDTNFFFRITSPDELAVQSNGAVTVSGTASANFRTVLVTVNGISATVTDQGSNVTFATTLPVPLNVGLTPLLAVAELDGRSTLAEARAIAYEFTGWHRDSERVYDGLHPDDTGIKVYDDRWSQEDSWDATTKTNVQRSIHHFLDTYSWYTGSTDTNQDDGDQTTLVYSEAPITQGSFGFDDVRDQAVSHGLNSWDHDHLTMDDRVTFCKLDEKRETQMVILQFENLAYLGDPNSPPAIDPSAITFWGQTGFWYHGLVSFIVPLETYRAYTITESDFTWPAFQFRGPRTDVQPSYTSPTVASTRHRLGFSGLRYDRLKVEVTNIKFNHDTSSSAVDAINIRKDNDTAYDISNGEWVKDGQNLPACYTTNQSVTIQARFTVQPADITNADIWAVGTGSGSSLGDVVKTNVIFSGGVSSPEYVTFQVSGTTPNSIQKTTNDLWQWKLENVNDTGSLACDLNTSGPHTFYTILREPAPPWTNAAASSLNVWTRVLDRSCVWADGSTAGWQVLSNIVTQTYSMGVVYDGTEHYTHPDFTTFHLQNLLDDMDAALPVYMDCRDFANWTHSLSGSLGESAQFRVIERTTSPFTLTYNYILPAGQAHWSTDVWNFHQVGWWNSRVCDAALKLDDDSDPTQGPGDDNHIEKLSVGDMIQADYLDKLTETPDVTDVLTGACTPQ